MKKIFKAITKYFKGVKKEISRIRWTTPKDLLKYSVTTISFMLALGVYFYVIDLIISWVRSVA